MRTLSEERIHSAFLFGKSRLDPLKATTIPKLELTATTVAVQIGRKFLTELDAEVNSITYWTDSTMVLHYLLTKTKGLPVFVANRVQQILEFTEPQQWKYVPTHINPADIASREAMGKNFKDIHKWLEMPNFLKQTEDSWPDQLEHDQHERRCCSLYYPERNTKKQELEKKVRSFWKDKPNNICTFHSWSCKGGRRRHN